MEFGNYIVIDSLGQGRFGSVYLVEKRDQDNVYAIKVIQKKLAKLQEDIINNELKIIKSINHKNILKIYEIFQDVDNYYIVEEFCNGGSVQDLLSNNNNINQQQIYYIISQVICAFQYLQSKQIIHRDIKPSNILIHYNQIKICDIGYSKYFQETQNNSFLESFHTMAPEGLNGIISDSSDIFSLGCTIYYMYTKKYPFETSNVQEKIKLQSQDIQFNFKISTEMQKLIKESLKYNFNDRISWSEIFKGFLVQNYKAVTLINEKQWDIKKKLENPKELVSLIKFKKQKDNNNNVKENINYQTQPQQLQPKVHVPRLYNLDHISETREYKEYTTSLSPKNQIENILYKFNNYQSPQKTYIQEENNFQIPSNSNQKINILNKTEVKEPQYKRVMISEDTNNQYYPNNIQQSFSPSKPLIKIFSPSVSPCKTINYSPTPSKIAQKTLQNNNSSAEKIIKTMQERVAKSQNNEQYLLTELKKAQDEKQQAFEQMKSSQNKYNEALQTEQKCKLLELKHRQYELQINQKNQQIDSLQSQIKQQQQNIIDSKQYIHRLSSNKLLKHEVSIYDSKTSILQQLEYSIPQKLVQHFNNFINFFKGCTKIVYSTYSLKKKYKFTYSIDIMAYLILKKTLLQVREFIIYIRNSKEYQKYKEQEQYIQQLNELDSHIDRQIKAVQNQISLNDPPYDIILEFQDSQKVDNHNMKLEIQDLQYHLRDLDSYQDVQLIIKDLQKIHDY